MTELTFLGTGTSQGVPIIGCRCPVCSSADPRDKRFRASALVRHAGLTVLVDAGPDFRMQMLAAKVRHLDAILLTHNHKDHTGGLDDVRALNYIDRKAVEIYCEERVLRSLRTEYSYAFADRKYPGSPEWHLHLIDEQAFRIPGNDGEGTLEWVRDSGYFFRMPDGRLVPSDNAVRTAEKARPETVRDILDGQEVQEETGWATVVPIRGYHDTMPVLGFRFGNIAYITDMSSIPETEFDKLQGLEHVTLNTVSYHPHHSHFSLDEALETAGRIGARHTWLTHLSHSFPVYDAFCDELERRCAERHIASVVRPAYDGLVIRA